MQTPPFMIREADVPDAAAIVGLIRELAADDGLDTPLDASYVKHFLAHPKCHVLLADINGEILGLLSYLLRPDLYHGGDTAYIAELIVSEKARDQGVGNALMETLFRRLEALGCPEVSVSTMPDNEGAIKFYKRHGMVDEAVYLEKHFSYLPQIRDRG
jgi:ribosomal protein S18 acetylase RimI-like enzyme